MNTEQPWLGEEFECVMCGCPMLVNGQMCHSCKEKCAYHGTPLDVDGTCPKCKRSQEAREAHRRSVEERYAKRRAEEKARWDALTPEQQQAERDRIDANAAAREARRIARKQAGIAKAVATRARRREKHINLIAEKYVAGKRFGPAEECAICSKELSDPVSIGRGIGSDCWQEMLERIERTRGGMKLIQGGLTPP
jgi:hypothetical protein